MKIIKLIYLSLLFICIIKSECEPENVNITLGDKFNRGGKSSLLKIGFISKKRCSNPKLELKYKNGNTRKINFDLIDIYLLKIYNLSQHSYYKRYVYLVEITKLEDLSKFDYSISRSDEDKDPKNFEYRSKILLEEELNLVMFGDHPLNEIGRKVTEAIKTEEIYDGLIILGDLAYDLHDNWGINGDLYFKMLEPLISRVPFFGITGNHDMIDGGHIMNFRFRFPGSVKRYHNNFYNFVLANSLYIFMNPDRYTLVTNEKRDKIIRSTSEILEKFEKRKEKAFKFLFSHRPFNCLKFDGNESCSRYNGIIWDAIQKLIAKQNFDFHFCGHVHLYQRFNNHYFHTQNHILDNDFDKKTFDLNSVIIGTGGMNEDLMAFISDPTFNKTNEISFIPNLKGFLRVKISEKNHLRAEMIDIMQEKKTVVDKFIAISNYKAALEKRALI